MISKTVVFEARNCLIIRPYIMHCLKMINNILRTHTWAPVAKITAGQLLFRVTCKKGPVAWMR